MVVDATGSEVALTYEIEISNLSETMPKNLKFYSSSTFIPENELELIDGKILFTGEIALEDIDTPVTTTVYWAWGYETEDGDAQDTLDGIAAATPTFDIKITGIQMDPNAESYATITEQKTDTNGDTYYLPTGFKYLLGTVETGLVIEDNEGNQFVWIPVADAGLEYSKLTGSYTTFIEASDTTDDDLHDDITSEQEQIDKYGGFYIARYEAGIPDSIVAEETAATTEDEMKAVRNVSGIAPVSKQNQVPWNYIDYDHAKANAESMYSNDAVQSGLVTGTQWDVVMKWLENSEPEYDVRTNSSSFGNYRNTSFTSSAMDDTSPYGNSWAAGTTTTDTAKYALFKTGSAETISNNIYDLAGNLTEWTNEIYSAGRVTRGGSFTYRSSNSPAADRYYYNTTSTDYEFGFRVSLYLK
jgi:formylglycine-generating enzyme required for sulfatase activity